MKRNNLASQIGIRLEGKFVSKNVINLSRRNLCTSEIYLLYKGLKFGPTNVKCGVRLLMFEKPNQSFNIGSITIKANIELSGKETEKYPRNFSTTIIVWMFISELMIAILLF